MAAPVHLPVHRQWDNDPGVPTKDSQPSHNPIDIGKEVFNVTFEYVRKIIKRGILNSYLP